MHLSIGQVYAFSVFKTPLVEHFGTKLTPIGIIFSIAIVMLGLSAAVCGTWVERSGPRKAMFVAALLLVAPASSSARSASRPTSCWLVYLGYGVIGGIGLGIGYISPVSTLIKWFPDRPGPGHRPRDHGLRRRRADRLAAVRRAARARSPTSPRTRSHRPSSRSARSTS